MAKNEDASSSLHFSLVWSMLPGLRRSVIVLIEFVLPSYLAQTVALNIFFSLWVRWCICQGKRDKHTLYLILLA